MAIRVSSETRRRIEALFSIGDRGQVTELIENECGNNLPFLSSLDGAQLERFRFAALKLSEGNIEKLKNAITLAKTDWRDLLMSAGFQNPDEHKRWFPNRGSGQE